MRLIDEPIRLERDGGLVARYARLPDLPELAPLRRLRASDWWRATTSGVRTGGTAVRQAQFGSKFPNHRKGLHYADTSTAIERAHPAVYAPMKPLADAVTRVVDEIEPGLLDVNRAFLRDYVHPRYHYGEAFTGGVANVGAMSLHRDRPNAKGSWSVTVWVREAAVGGYLVVPDLDVAFAAQDAHCLVFQGEQHTHGVTETRPIVPTGLRVGVVFYASRLLEGAGSRDEEIARANRISDASGIRP